MKPIKLSDVASKLECIMDDCNCYMNKETGEIIELEDRFFQIVENSEPGSDFGDYLEWERAIIKLAEAIWQDSDQYHLLPTKYDINEYDMIEAFCLSIQDNELREKFLKRIKGRGAFRRFKDFAYQTDLIDEWYNYKWNAYLKIAKEWCDEQQIPYYEE